MKNAFSCQKRKLLIVQNDKSDVDKIGKGWYIPVFDSNVWKNTAERLILYSFSGGAVSFYNIVFFYENQKCVFVLN